MTFADLQNLTAYWLDDLQFGYFTQTQVKVWLNNAQKEVQKLLVNAGNARYNKWVQTTLVVNQTDYVLPQDFKKVQNLEVVVSGTVPNESTSPILPITTNQKYLVASQTGTPRFYRFRKNRLVLTPAPDTALTMRLEYTYLVSDMTLDTDIPDVPDEYQELIALLACADGFIKDGRVNDLLEKKIAVFRSDLDMDAQERNQDQPRGIVETGNNADSGFYW